MKILMIDESIDRVGGVERVISTLANRLSKDNEVCVLSEFKISSEPFYKYNSNIKIEYLINATNQKTTKLKSKGIKYYFYRIFEKIKSKILLKNRIKKSVKQMKEVDTIIFGRVFVALDFLPIIKKYRIKANIIVRDAIHLEYYSKRVKNDILKFFPNAVNTFIVSSDESIKAYKNFFENENINIVKIYNPLGILPSNCGSYENKTIISIGRMDKQKGYESLIRAFKLVTNELPDWKIKIYGDGNHQKKVRELIIKLNLQNKVFIMPTIKDVTRAFNEASIFILPSRYEGYANILVEAMACGMPVISYNWLMGVEEIVTDKENGIVVPLQNRYRYFEGGDSEEDDEQLAKAIVNLINDKELYEKISKNASKIIDSRKIDRIVNEWLKWIK